MLRLIIAILFLFMALSGCTGDKVSNISSPNGSIQFSLVESKGSIFYYIMDSVDTIIGHSQLGLRTRMSDFRDQLSIAKITMPSEVTQERSFVAGNTKHIKKAYTHQVLHLQNLDNERLGFEVRVYNDAVAFRYLLNDLDSSYVEEEYTSFALPDGKAFMMPYDDVSRYTPAYENYFGEYRTGEDSPLKNGWCFPALFEDQKGKWTLISEAGPFGSGYGSHLQQKVHNGVYAIRLPERGEALDHFDNSAEMTETPWRVIEMGDLNTIINANTVKLLAPKADTQDISWIQPGRVAWSWLSDHDSPQDFDKQIRFINMAAEMGWEYSLIDANWQNMKGGSVDELVTYAEEKNVGIFLWYNSGGPHNDVSEMPRDLMFEEDLRKREFQRIHELGFKGIKVDFFQSDKPRLMELYQDILKDAMIYKLLVNFHGCTIPRGWEAMYPNLMTMESVKGAENYTFAADYPINAPKANTILPFTRNAIGSMDYTPVTFSHFAYSHLTSKTHELALAVVFESGLMHFADDADAYLNLEKEAKKLLQEIPTTWDKSIVLDANPGKYAVIARKDQDCWFVGGINGEDKPKSILLNLEKLVDANLTKGILFFDETGNIGTEMLDLQENEQIEIELKAYGGFALKIETKSY